MMDRPSKSMGHVLAVWAFIMYVVTVCFCLRLVWEALAGPHGAQKITAVCAVLCAVSGTVYLFCSLRSER